MGGELYSTKVKYGKTERTYPDMEVEKINISVDEIKKMLGVEIGENDIKNILARMRYNININNGELEVMIPPYRHDIHHPWDLIEDIAIGFGMDEFEGTSPKEYVVGKPRVENKIIDAINETLIGYSFQEVVNFTLSNPDREYKYMEMNEDSAMTVIENPVSEEHTGLRAHILPTLLDNLKSNRNKSLPQKLFEVGDVVKDSKQTTKVGGVVLHSETGFTEMKSLIEGIAVNLGLEIDIISDEHDSFIDGRCASIKINEDVIGYFGEIHPKVLDNFELEYPTTAFELNIDKISELKLKDQRLI